MAFPGFEMPKAPGLKPMGEYPELDLTGIKDWLSSSLARQYMGAGFRPSQIGGIAAKTYAPLLQMEAEHPFKKWGAGEEARRFGAGYGADVWRTEAGIKQNTWSQMLQAAMERARLAAQERMFGAQFGQTLSPMERYGGPYNLRP